MVLAASAALLLARLAPGDHLAGFEVDPDTATAERHRFGLDRPLHEQYAAWAGGVLRLDMGESTRFPGRPVSALLAERAGNSILVGTVALILATVIGIPLGILSGSRTHALAHATHAAALLFLSIPPVVLSLALLLLASRTGWFPVGGWEDDAGVGERLHHLVLPVLALALPIAAVLERLQARSMSDALRDRAVLAARARGVPPSRLVWRHAFRLSLRPVLAVYGVIVGALISGSFVVEYVMGWPGLARLMYDALIARDASLVAGCVATGAAFLGVGVLLSDVALAVADPRTDGLR